MRKPFVGKFPVAARRSPASALGRVGLVVVALAALGCSREKASQPPPAASAAPVVAAPVVAGPGVAAPLAPGAPAPDVTFALHTGEQMALSSLRGKPVVVYFYPKDDTPGCTVEAQEI